MFTGKKRGTMTILIAINYNINEYMNCYSIITDMGSITFEGNILQLQLPSIGPITITITFENHYHYYNYNYF